MNISLRQMKMDDSQTMFITSTGTVLFTSYTMYDQCNRPSTTVITSISDQGSIVKSGLIMWNDATGGIPSLFVGRALVNWRMIGQDDSCITFRGGDSRVYQWRAMNDMIILSVYGASGAPIALAYHDTQSTSRFDPAGSGIILCIQPTGFHLLYEIVATFILFEQLCRRTDYDRKVPPGLNLCGGSYIHSRNPRILLTKDRPRMHVHSQRDVMGDPNSGLPGRMRHVSPAILRSHEEGARRCIPCLRIPNLTRSTADLTGELLRRYKYPSACGGYGDIWKCDWLKDSRVIEVAVKVMRTNLTGGQQETESKRISRELRVWVKLEHECVLPLYGISFDFGKLPAMVCPWIEGGTLSKYLEHNEGLPLHTRLHLLSDVANGLHYLHGCGIVHGDLTGFNVLIKDNGKACLSDFGLSRIFMEATGSSCLTSTVRGSIRWAAPELFELEGDHQKEPLQVLPNPQSDVYSFGSTMLQVFTGKVPYYYYKNDAQVLVALSRGLRPVRPEEPPIGDFHWEFMQRCWSSQSKLLSKNVRPSIEEIVDFLSVSRVRSQEG